CVVDRDFWSNCRRCTIIQCLTKMRDQLGTFKNDEAVIECIALIRFRKTAGDDARNSFELQSCGRLFTTRTASKVQSAYDHIAFFIKRVEIWIVVFESDRGHLLSSHVVAVSVFAP